MPEGNKVPRGSRGLLGPLEKEKYESALKMKPM
jgi:hypothetical protein